MVKWADYLISEVAYGANHCIFLAKRHECTKNGICHPTMVDRLTIASDIRNGQSHATVYSTPDSWKMGHRIKTFRINGEPYIRVDANHVALDSLGDIPELQDYHGRQHAPNQLTAQAR